MAQESLHQRVPVILGSKNEVEVVTGVSPVSPSRAKTQPPPSSLRREASDL